MAGCLQMVLLFCVHFLWTFPECCSGLGIPAQYMFYNNRSPLLPSQTQILRTDNTLQQDQVRQTLRRTGMPYAIFYPLTFKEPLTKRQDGTVALNSPQTDPVESRVMNKPQPHPQFGIPPPAVEVIEELAIPEPPQNSGEDDRPLILPQHRPPQQNAIVYQYEVLPRPGDYETRVDYFPYDHPQRFNNTVHHGVHHHSTTTWKPPVPSPLKPPSKIEVTKHKSPQVPAFYKETVPAPPVYDSVRVQNQKQQQQQVATCICVPYYLCKDGILNSGGRLHAFKRRTARSLNLNPGNHSHHVPYSPAKIVNLYGKERSSDTCGPNKVCCQVLLEGTIDESVDDNHYPVATPPPEHPYVFPPRYPHQEPACGTRRVYGVQGRLFQLQYGSDVAEFGEYPWQVAILKKVQGDKSLYLCGGVLVAPQWVATVAHCLKRDKSSPLLIRLGEWDVNRKDEVYPFIEKDVTTIVIHPEFDPESLVNDLALMRMVDPVDPRVPHVTPACLPFPGQVFEEQKCWVSGWGKDFFGPQGAYQNVLKEVDVGVVSPSLCSTELRSTKLGSDFKLHPGFLCAGGEAGKDACTGDGGSPLVCKSREHWFVVGLVSWGIGCGQVGIPGVYTNVLYFTDWINSITLR